MSKEKKGTICIEITEEDIKEQEETLKNIELEIKTLWDDVKLFTSSSSIIEAKNFITTLKQIKNKVPKLEELKKYLTTLNDDINKLKEEISEKENIEKQLKEAEDKGEELNNLIKDLDNRLSALKEKLGKMKQRLKDIESDLDLIAKYKSEVEKENKELEKLEIDKAACDLLASSVFSPGALPAKLLKEYIELLESYANDYLRIFGQNITISLNFIERRGQQSIDLKVYANGYLRRIETFSGGESMLIGFAIRLAIGRMLAELYAGLKRPKFLIIDEGFGPLDEESRQKVADALANLYKTKEYEQIIVISHQQDLKTYPIFKTILEVKKNENDISHVEEITNI